MSQQQDSSFIHYRTVARVCGESAALHQAATDVDDLRAELGRRRDCTLVAILMLSLFSFSLGLTLGWLFGWLFR